MVSSISSIFSIKFSSFGEYASFRRLSGNMFYESIPASAHNVSYFSYFCKFFYIIVVAVNVSQSNIHFYIWDLDFMPDHLKHDRSISQKMLFRKCYSVSCDHSAISVGDGTSIVSFNFWEVSLETGFIIKMRTHLLWKSFK